MPNHRWEKLWRRLPRKSILIVIAVLLAIRIALPFAAEKYVNHTLATLSPKYSGKVSDVDISLLAFRYGIDSIELVTKDTKETFFRADRIDVSLAWRELLKGKVVTDVTISEANASISDHTIEVVSQDKKKKELAEKAQDKLFPLKIERVSIKNSKLTYLPSGSTDKSKELSFSNVEAEISNLIPSDENSRTIFSGKGTLFGSSVLKVAGALKLEAKPIEWDVDVESRKFHLPSMNPLLELAGPISFDDGLMDFFMEAKSENERIDGYVKLFVKDLEFMGNRRDFLGVKHFLFEGLGGLAALVLENFSSNTLATKIPFSKMGKETNIEFGKALEIAVDHAQGDFMGRALDGSIELGE